MIILFALRFERGQIAGLAKKYSDVAKPPIKDLENRIEFEIAPKAKACRCLEKDQLLAICRWKSLRTQKHCAVNDEDFVRTVSSTALATSDERLRIEALALLCGVEWPTASVILHFCSNERYPILDFRALWSLGVDVPKAYDFDFWTAYAQYCRRLADESHATMRTLDRALWQFSKDNQRHTAQVMAGRSA